MSAVPEHEPRKARALAYLQHNLRAGAALPLKTMADLLERNPYDIVAQSLRSPGIGHLPPEDRLQAHLRAILAVLQAAHAGFRSVGATVHWYRHTELAPFARRTPEVMTAGGRADELLAWLAGQAIESAGDLD